MPPRYAYWTILVGGGPTSFRARESDELLPTLRQIQRRHPDASLCWFERGRIWPSPEAALAARRPATPARPTPRRPAGERGRGRDWRPGGEHRDPKARFKVPRKVRRKRYTRLQRLKNGKKDEE